MAEHQRIGPADGSKTLLHFTAVRSTLVYDGRAP